MQNTIRKEEKWWQMVTDASFALRCTKLHFFHCDPIWKMCYTKIGPQVTIVGEGMLCVGDQKWLLKNLLSLFRILAPQSKRLLVKLGKWFGNSFTRLVQIDWLICLNFFIVMLFYQSFLIELWLHLKLLLFNRIFQGTIVAKRITFRVS